MNDYLLSLLRNEPMPAMKKLSLCIDLVFCLVILPVMILLFPVERWFHFFPIYTVCMGVWLYGLYFINRRYVVPLLLTPGRLRGLGIMLISITLAFTCGIASIELYTPNIHVMDVGIERRLPIVEQYQQALLSLFMIVEAFSFVVGLLTHAEIQNSRRREAEASRDRAEVAFYRARINPHFMFNTLNSIYGLFLTHHEKGMASLEQFISLMRHIHMTSGCEKVPLVEESENIRRFIELQSLRLSDKTVVSLNIEVENNRLPVPPMLLMTLVENCFKYGVSPVEKSVINISLHESDDKIRFTTTNRVFSSGDAKSGTGLSNCRQRLKLLYPGRHSFKVSGDKKYFNVNLTIDL